MVNDLEWLSFQIETGAVAQYPPKRLRNDGVRFLDGSYQRYRDSVRCVADGRFNWSCWTKARWRRWRVLPWQKRAHDVPFTDPWDGHDYENWLEAMKWS